MGYEERRKEMGTEKIEKGEKRERKEGKYF